MGARRHARGVRAHRECRWAGGGPPLAARRGLARAGARAAASRGRAPAAVAATADKRRWRHVLDRARLSLCLPCAQPRAGFHRHRSPHPRPRHWRQHRHVRRRQRGAAEAAAVQGSWRADARPPHGLGPGRGALRRRTDGLVVPEIPHPRRSAARLWRSRAVRGARRRSVGGWRPDARSRRGDYRALPWAAGDCAVARPCVHVRGSQS